MTKFTKINRMKYPAEPQWPVDISKQTIDVLFPKRKRHHNKGE